MATKRILSGFSFHYKSLTINFSEPRFPNIFFNIYKILTDKFLPETTSVIIFNIFSNPTY